MASSVFTVYSIIFVVPLTMRGCAALLSRWVAHACCGGVVVVVGSDREEESLDYVSTVVAEMESRGQATCGESR